MWFIIHFLHKKCTKNLAMFILYGYTDNISTLNMYLNKSRCLSSHKEDYEKENKKQSFKRSACSKVH